MLVVLGIPITSCLYSCTRFVTSPRSLLYRDQSPQMSEKSVLFIIVGICNPRHCDKLEHQSSQWKGTWIPTRILDSPNHEYDDGDRSEAPVRV